MKVCPRCELKYPDEEERCFVDNMVLVAAPDPYIGSVIDGKYLVEGKLGEGGMATVYRARHRLVDRPVALKILHRELARDPKLRERFRREAKNAAALAHPNIIEIDDYGETADDSVYLAMELLDGAPLDVLIAQGAMPPAQVAALGLQIAQGLARAHDFEVIHRDLKPENIFVSRLSDDRRVVKLLDFGIARSMHDPRLTNRGEVFGTPQYMAPERLSSIDCGPEADLYALGVILFEMLTGRLPFEANDLPGFFIAHLQEVPPKPSSLVPSCPRRLEELILKLLEKKPEARPVDAHQVIRELSALAPTDGRDSAVPPQPSSAGRQVAPTLPPTTLDQWASRAAVFERMLVRAFPAGQAPAALVAALAEIRGAITRIHELRSGGLKHQRVLEGLEAAARGDRARLGNAVQTLATDLSSAREGARTARAEVEPYFEADREAEAAYRRAHASLEKLGGYVELGEPRTDMVDRLRDVLDTLDRWVLAHGASEKAREWIDAKASEVNDIEFQVRALRNQLERCENDYESKRGATESILRQSGEQMGELENQLMHIAGRFVEPLRHKSEVRDLFAELTGD